MCHVPLSSPYAPAVLADCTNSYAYGMMLYLSVCLSSVCLPVTYVLS